VDVPPVSHLPIERPLGFSRFLIATYKATIKHLCTSFSMNIIIRFSGINAQEGVQMLGYKVVYLFIYLFIFNLIEPAKLWKE
jgi:hypothetical protein